MDWIIHLEDVKMSQAYLQQYTHSSLAIGTRQSFLNSLKNFNMTESKLSLFFLWYNQGFFFHFYFQECIKDVMLVQMFDPVTSPRCYGIIAYKHWSMSVYQYLCVIRQEWKGYFLENTVFWLYCSSFGITTCVKTMEMLMMLYIYQMSFI